MPGPDDSPEMTPSGPDALFDAFMERALELRPGDQLEPGAFLDEHPELEPEVREELEQRLLAIARLAAPVAEVAETALDVEGEIERSVGEYRLIRSLGGGAMGEVFLAEQSSLGRLVALKTQRAELVNSPSAAARFEREARALGSVTHPSVVGVYGFGEAEGVRFLAMELVPGRSLKERLEDPREGEAAPTPVEIASWGAELARGLGAVHAAGLVHRDVKPSNVRITEAEETASGRAVLVDFGLARVGDSSELSRTGEFIGSPAYASPEQVRGEKELDGRSDVYSLGATLYAALAGRAPFTGEHLEAVLNSVLHREPSPLERVAEGLPRDLCLVVHKALEKEPERRYQSAIELAEDLEAVLELRPVSAKPLGRAGRALRWMRRNRLAAGALAAAVLAVVTAAGYVTWSARETRLDKTREARGLLTQAEDALNEFRTARLELASEEAVYDRLWGLQEYEHLGPERAGRLIELGGRVKAARERRNQAFVRGENLLASAVRLDPEVESQAQALGAKLVLERLIEATAKADKESAAFLSVELDRLDPDRALRDTAFPFAHVTTASGVPGTEAWLFRYEALDDLVPGGEPRLVPIPVRPDDPSWRPEPRVPFGTEVLRIASPAPEGSGLSEGDLITHMDGFPIGGGPLVAQVAPRPELGEPAVQPGDRLVAIDTTPLEDPWQHTALLADQPDVEHSFHFASGAGGPQRKVSLAKAALEANGVQLESLRTRAERLGGVARVVHAGQVLELELPSGLSLRPSLAAPELCPEAALTLDAELPFEPGTYLVVSRAPGHRLTRHVIHAAAGTQLARDVSPVLADAAPPGFVLVANSNPTEPDFWIAEREVTADEYLEFLNQPASLERVEAGLTSGALVLAPRAGSQSAADFMWGRDASGRFFLPPTWPTTWPVLGVSLDDAEDFARWKSRSIASGRFSLPSAWQTTAAGGATASQRYSWGTRFDQRFANTCFSRVVARPEPVFANPRDESPFGVYDTCGNALEWTTSPYDDSRDLRHAIGGSWGQARIDTLSPGGGLGLPATAAGGETGMRLIFIAEEASDE